MAYLVMLNCSYKACPPGPQQHLCFDQAVFGCEIACYTNHVLLETATKKNQKESSYLCRFYARCVGRVATTNDVKCKSLPLDTPIKQSIEHEYAVLAPCTSSHANYHPHIRSSVQIYSITSYAAASQLPRVPPQHCSQASCTWSKVMMMVATLRQKLAMTLKVL